MTTPIMKEIFEGRVHLKHMPAPFLVELRAHMLEHARQGRVDRALEYAQALLLSSPESVESWLLVAGMYRHLGMSAQSLRCIEQAHTHDPKDRAVRLSRGELWIELGRPKQGLDEIKTVFLEGWRPELEPQEQDDVTLRAGALLETLQRAIEIQAQES